MADLTSKSAPKYESRALRLSQLNEDAQEVAKLMCDEMGLDPMEIVQVDNGFPVLQWEIHLDHALLALAGWRAVHKFALTQG